MSRLSLPHIEDGCGHEGIPARLPCLKPPKDSGFFRNFPLHIGLLPDVWHLGREIARLIRRTQGFFDPFHPCISDEHVPKKAAGSIWREKAERFRQIAYPG